MIEKTDSSQWLAGKKGLVLGVANDKSIAWGCAKAFHAMGAELAITYQNEKTKTYTEGLSQQVNTGIYMPCDVQLEGSMEAVIDAIKNKWGRLDFALHSIAFAPMNDLHGRVTDCSRDGFLLAMDVSCHSFIRMARLLEPLMTEGGSLMAVSYHGAQQVVQNYNIMGPVKAALESSVRYLASELGPRGIRVNAISPGPVSTRAGSGIKGFDILMEQKEKASPLGKLASQEDSGWLAAFLASEKASSITGTIMYVDCGVSQLG